MGGAFSVELSWIFNVAFSDLTGISLESIDNRRPFEILAFAYSVGFNEELWKLGAACLILKWGKREVRHPLDIMFLGVAVSLGFSLWENIMYGHRYSWSLSFWRSLLPGHIVYGAVWSYGLKELYAGNKSREAKRFFVVSWLLAAIFHGTYDFFIFLNKNWTFIIGILLVWLPVIVFHLIFRNLSLAKQQNRLFFREAAGNATIRNSGRGDLVPVKTLVRKGKRPVVTSKAIYISRETEKKLFELCQRRQQKTGKPYSPNLYVRSIIQLLYEKKDRYNGMPFFELPGGNSQRSKASGFVSNRCVNVSYSTLRLMDEMRRQTESNFPGCIPRHLYLNGLINRLHAARN